MISNNRMLLIGGPCVIEDLDCLYTVAETVSNVCEKLKIDYYFKASFDKANRTSINSYRGPGIKKGSELLQKVKTKFGVKVATDIHEPWQAEQIAPVADIIQIPAFLCRQTDLLIAAGNTGKIINVKKAQFLAPWDMKNVIGKIESTGNTNILLCERGSMFGYNRLVVDMTGIIEMKKLGYPVVFDSTHSVQIPGGKGDCTGGNNSYIEPLTKSAIAAGADHLFMEIHPNPEKALSDGPNMVPLKNFEPMMNRVMKVYYAVRDN